MEDEEDLCRICRCPGERENPLRYPCACRGSIKYVHQSCLFEWLNLRRISRCEICQHAFSFAPLYAENTPERLPPWEFAIGLASRSVNGLKTFLHLVVIVFVWVFIVPLYTHWFSKLVSSWSFVQVAKSLLSHKSWQDILGDWLDGSLISLIILGVCLVLMLPLLLVLPRVLVWRFIVGSVRPTVAFLILGGSMIFLLVTVFIPFTIGRVVSLSHFWLYSNIQKTIWFYSALKSPEFTKVTRKDVVSALTNFSSARQCLVSEFNIQKVGLESFPGNIKMSETLYDGQNVTTAELSDGITLLVGYIALVSLVLLYHVVVLSMHYAQGRQLTLKKIIVRVQRIFTAAFCEFRTEKKHLRTFLKAALVLGIKVGMFPFLCGWWLDICTLRMFEATFTGRIESLVDSPFLVSCIYWIIGLFYVIWISVSLDLVLLVLPSGALHIHWDLANTDRNRFANMFEAPLQKHICFTLKNVCVHGSLILMLVYIPIQLVVLVAPSIFPVDLTYLADRNLATRLSEIYIFNFGSPFALYYCYPSRTVKLILYKWLTVMCRAVGLGNIVMPLREGNVVPENGRALPEWFLFLLNGAPEWFTRLPSAGEVALGLILGTYMPVITDTEGNRDKKAHAKYRVGIRVMLLLLLAWITLLLFNSSTVLVPLVLGRACFKLSSHLPILHEINCNDLYAFIFGACIMRGVLVGGRYAIKLIRAKGMATFLSHIWGWTVIALRCSALMSIWTIFIPFLLGLVFDLMVIIPIRAPQNESPLFFLWRDWLLGVFFLHLWAVLVISDKLELFANGSWRMKIRRVINDGLPRIPVLWAFQEILLPITLNLLKVLCVPYLFAKGAFLVAGYSIAVNSVINRLCWSGCLGFIVLRYCVKTIPAVIIYLHNSIRDDRYQVGQKLCDYGEHSQSSSST